MRREKTTIIIIALLLLGAAVLLSLYYFQDADTPEVTLADQVSTAEAGEQSPPQNPLAHLEITPENVQSVIATLYRPAQYSREISKTRYWSGGSASATATAEIWSKPEAVRIRRDDGENMLITETAFYLWFEDGAYLARPITPAIGEGRIQILDEFQGFPSYEAVLDLRRDQILEAGYTLLTAAGETGYAIYVVVQTAQLGYVDRFYISLRSGLLVEMETWDGDIRVYHMETLSLDLGVPDADMFLLPGGRDPVGDF